MSIIRAAVKLIIREHAHYHFEGPAISLGVPEIHATEAEVRGWFPELAGVPSQLPPGEGEISDNKIGRRLNWMSANSFFRALGLSGVNSLDVPGSEHRAEIKHDLNDPLPPEFRSRHKLVLDPGTLEHVFDQRACMETIVRLLDVGGVVIHLVPTYMYNGGYYSINPNVLNDFYALNGFEDIKAYILMWDRYRGYAKIKTRCYAYRQDVLGSRHALADFDQVRYSPMLLFFARKTREMDVLKAPLQFGGDYVGQASALEVARGQSLERVGKKWAARVQQWLPYNLANYLQTMVYRHLVLWRARRAVGFWI